MDKYGKCKNNYDKPEGYGKGGMIKGYKNGGKVTAPKPKKKPVTPREGAVIESGNRIGKEEAAAAKKLKEQKNGKKKKKY